jgi:hypothetical protein
MCLVRLRSLLLVPCLAAILTVGCQGNAQLNPTAPTSPLGSTALTTDDAPELAATASRAGDVIAFARGGNGNGADKDKDKDKGGDSSDAESDEGEHKNHGGVPGGPGHGNRGQLSGFVTAVTASSLTVRGITVMVDSTTVIRHGYRILTMADIQVGDHVQARGVMDGTTLEATEIKVEDTEGDDDGEDDDEAEGPNKVAGKVSELSGTCAAGLTFKVKSTVVTTGSTTTFPGTTCAAIVDGERVEVEGTRQANGSIAAASVELD